MSKVKSVMVNEKKEFKVEIDEKIYIVKSPKPSELPLFTRISMDAKASDKGDIQMLYLLALVGLTLKQPNLNVDKPKRNEDGEITNREILQYGERVADSLDELGLAVEDLIKLLNATGGMHG